MVYPHVLGKWSRHTNDVPLHRHRSWDRNLLMRCASQIGTCGQLKRVLDDGTVGVRLIVADELAERLGTGLYGASVDESVGVVGDATYHIFCR